MIASAISSTIDQSYTAKGTEAADTMTSSTPSAAKSRRRSRHASGVPVSVSLA
jgi:hypothetical protein